MIKEEFYQLTGVKATFPYLLHNPFSSIELLSNLSPLFSFFYITLKELLLFHIPNLWVLIHLFLFKQVIYLQFFFGPKKSFFCLFKVITTSMVMMMVMKRVTKMVMMISPSGIRGRGNLWQVGPNCFGDYRKCLWASLPLPPLSPICGDRFGLVWHLNALDLPLCNTSDSCYSMSHPIPRLGRLR